MHIIHTTSQDRQTVHQTQRLQSILKPCPQVRILAHRSIRISKTQIIPR